MKVVSRSQTRDIERNKAIRMMAEREIKLQASLCDPRIVRFYEWFEDQSNIYMILEYCEKGELYQYFKFDCTEDKPPSSAYPGSLETLMSDILRATFYLHSQKIVHRDLKLGNILLDNDYRAKLADFGLSLTMLEANQPEVAGTPLYMSPELIRGECESMEKADCWAVGIILFIIQEHVHPFVSTQVHSPAEVLKEIELKKPEVKRGSSPFWNFLILRLLDKVDRGYLGS
jgi:serine/threonine protein kinase